MDISVCVLHYLWAYISIIQMFKSTYAMFLARTLQIADLDLCICVPRNNSLVINIPGLGYIFHAKRTDSIFQLLVVENAFKLK